MMDKLVAAVISTPKADRLVLWVMVAWMVLLAVVQMGKMV